MTAVGFVAADIEGRIIPAHNSVLQPIFDLLSRSGFDCKWGQYSEPWGTISGVDRNSVSCWVTCEPGMPSNQFIDRTFFHPHGLHPTESAYVMARAPNEEYRPWLGYLSPGSYWSGYINSTYTERGDALHAGRLPVTGWAKMDAAFEPNVKEKTIQAHGLDLPYSKTVLYAPTGNWDWASSFDKSIKTILTIFEGLAYNLIVKTGNYAMSFQEYGTLLDYLTKGPKHIRGIHYDANVVPLYTLADAVITDGSSVAWEAIALDKPTIQLNNMIDAVTSLVPGILDCENCPYGAYDPNSKPPLEIRALFKQYPKCRFCGGVEKTGLEGLRETIIRNVENPNEHADIRHEWAKKVNSPCDGHVAERCVAEIRRIAGI